MAAAAVATKRVVRCPVCLTPQGVRQEADRHAQLYCPGCSRNFAVRQGLPLPSAAGPFSDPSAAAAIDPSRIWPGVVIGVSALIGLFVLLRVEMKGPTFLIFFGLLWLSLFVASFGLKTQVWGGFAGIVAFLLFEGIGIARIVIGIRLGMEKFLYLIIIMIVGGFALMARIGTERGWDLNSRSGCSSGCGSSCGSSCGGGCGGGVGCGGCGSS